MGAQRPTDPVRLQAEQRSVQALLQQTPSTQAPVAHCPLMVQACPCGRLSRQVPASQKNPFWQSVASRSGRRTNPSGRRWSTAPGLRRLADAVAVADPGPCSTSPRNRRARTPSPQVAAASARPSQVPSSPHIATGWTVQSLSGSWPAGTGRQGRPCPPARSSCRARHRPPRSTPRPRSYRRRTPRRPRRRLPARAPPRRQVRHAPVRLAGRYHRRPRASDCRWTSCCRDRRHLCGVTTGGMRPSGGLPGASCGSSTGAFGTAAQRHEDKGAGRGEQDRAQMWNRTHVESSFRLPRRPRGVRAGSVLSIPTFRDRGPATAVAISNAPSGASPSMTGRVASSKLRPAATLTPGIDPVNVARAI